MKETLWKVHFVHFCIKIQKNGNFYSNFEWPSTKPLLPTQILHLKCNRQEFFLVHWWKNQKWVWAWGGLAAYGFEDLLVLARSQWSILQNLVWLGFLRLLNFKMAFNHTTGLLGPQGFQEQWKRPMKVAKAKLKARIYEIRILYIFLVLLGLFGGIRQIFPLVWSSKVKKAKKAAS